MKELTICWSITTKCNLNCPYCFSKYDNDKSYDMSDRLINVTIKKLKEASEKYSIRLVILGGEPTLHPALKQICEKCLTFCRKVIVVTNGIKYDVINDLPKEVSVDLSYHGEELNLFYKTITSIKEYHFVQVLCPLYKNDLDKILSLIRWCKEHEIIYESIPIVDNESEIAENYEDDLITVVSSNVTYNIPMFNKRLTNMEIYKLNKNNVEETTKFHVCLQPNIAIYANGIYYPCCKSGLLYNKHHVEDDVHHFKLETLCNHRYCMENRGCLDFAGWRQDPDGFLFGNNE